MLDVGIRAPEITAPDLDGNQVSVSQFLGKGPVLVAFFKVSCPTCQYILPFLARMADNTGFTILGISQDDREKTLAFSEKYGLHLPFLLDLAASGYPISNAYRLTNVPSLFLIEPDHMISAASMGFSKTDLQAISDRFSAPLFRAGESIPEFRPG